MDRIPPFYFFVKQLIFRLDERLRLMIVGAVVGVCTGVTSVTFLYSLRYLFDRLQSLRGYWYAPVFPACGAALSIIFLRYIIKEAGVQGVSEVIYSISLRGGLLRFRSSFSRLISGILTITSGGSAGPEPLVVISGASIGSNIGTFFNLKGHHRSVIVGAGAAAAIASIFNAPVAGIAFSLEVILGEWTPVNILPIAIA